MMMDSTKYVALLGFREAMRMAAGKGLGLRLDELRAAAEAAGVPAWLFGEQLLKTDGWQLVFNTWVPPPRDALFDKPVRGKYLALDAPAKGSGGDPGGGSHGVASDPAPPDRGLRALSDTELRLQIEAAEEWRRAITDTEDWLHRWDARAAAIGHLLSSGGC